MRTEKITIQSGGRKTEIREDFVCNNTITQDKHGNTVINTNHPSKHPMQGLSLESEEGIMPPWRALEIILERENSNAYSWESEELDQYIKAEEVLKNHIVGPS